MNLRRFGLFIPADGEYFCQISLLPLAGIALLLVFLRIVVYPAAAHGIDLVLPIKERPPPRPAQYTLFTVFVDFDGLLALNGQRKSAEELARSLKWAAGVSSSSLFTATDGQRTFIRGIPQPGSHPGARSKFAWTATAREESYGGCSDLILGEATAPENLHWQAMLPMQAQVLILPHQKTPYNDFAHALAMAHRAGIKTEDIFVGSTRRAQCPEPIYAPIKIMQVP